MINVVYLMGTGATKAEMSWQGLEPDLSMRGISSHLLGRSREEGGEYSKLDKKFAFTADEDIEVVMSLLEGIDVTERTEFRKVHDELRRLFRGYLISEIHDKAVSPRIGSSLLYLHSRYGKYMGYGGEELLGVLTLNFDSLMDNAFRMIYSGINYGHSFQSPKYKENASAPPLLKLHGSFNWRVENGHLEVSDAFEKNAAQDYNGWMPPSVFKRPEQSPFQEIWERAATLLDECNVLRVVGSSLRNEDFALLSLIFRSRVRGALSSGEMFDVELLVPDEEAVGDGHGEGIQQRLRFLGPMKNLESLDIFRESHATEDMSEGQVAAYDLPKGNEIDPSLVGHGLSMANSVEAALASGNVFYDWVSAKVTEIERNTGTTLGDDNFLAKMLWEENSEV